MPAVRANGIQLYYEERGKGDPLVLIMGLGADGSLWEEHAAAYQQRFRCILLDNRGAGRSDKPDGPYTTAMMADDAAGLIQALDLGKVHVSGISMGGAIAQELAIRHPELVRSLTLNCTWARCDAYARNMFQVLRAFCDADRPVDFVHLVQLYIFAPETHAGNAARLHWHEALSLHHPHPMPPHAYKAQCDACLSHDSLERLRNIKAPTLITVGDRDIFTPLHFAQAIAQEVPGAELRIARGAGHAHHWEQLDWFNRLTLDFMRKH